MPKKVTISVKTLAGLPYPSAPKVGVVCRDANNVLISTTSLDAAGMAVIGPLDNGTTYQLKIYDTAMAANFGPNVGSVRLDFELDAKGVPSYTTVFLAQYFTNP